MNKELNYIVFTKTAKPINDFQVEEIYQKIKNRNFKYYEISNYMLFNRLRVGVYKKEIKPFNLIVHDSNGKIYEDTIDEYGKFNGNVFQSEILCLIDNYFDTLLGLDK